MLGGAAARAQDQQHGEVGVAVGQHVGGVGENDPPPTECRLVDVVVSHADGGDQAHAVRQGVDRGGIEPGAARDHQGDRSMGVRGVQQLGGRHLHGG